MEIAPETDLILIHHVAMTRKAPFLSNKVQLQNHPLTIFHKNKSFLSATSILCHSPVAYNNAAPLDKVTCPNCVDVDKSPDRIRQLFGPKNFPITRMEKSKFSRKLTTRISEHYKILQRER